MTSPFATQDRYPYQNEPFGRGQKKPSLAKPSTLLWAKELHELIQEAKRMANEIQKSSDLWDLEYHLTQRRKEIDHKYDVRGSRLTDVLRRLLYENRLGEEDLRGLQDEKIKSIRSFAQFLRDGAA